MSLSHRSPLDTDEKIMEDDWIDYSNNSAFETLVSRLEAWLSCFCGNVIDELNEKSTCLNRADEFKGFCEREPCSEMLGDVEFQDNHIENEKVKNSDVESGSTPSKDEDLNIEIDYENASFSFGLIRSDQEDCKRKFSSDLKKVITISKTIGVYLSQIEAQILLNCADFSNSLDNLCVFESDIGYVVDIQQCFGIRDYVWAYPISRDADIKKMPTILSGFGLAVQSCGASIPCFIPTVGGLEGPSFNCSTSDYCGLWIGGAEDLGTTVYFDSYTIDNSRIPTRLRYLSGILNLFRSKIYSDGIRGDILLKARTQSASEGEENSELDDSIELDISVVRQLHQMKNEGCIYVSAKYTIGPITYNKESPILKRGNLYSTEVSSSHWPDPDDDSSWRLHLRTAKPCKALQKLRGGPNEAPLWGPLLDPLPFISLKAIWTPFKENRHVEIERYSSFSLDSADIWVVSAHFFDCLETNINSRPERDTCRTMSCPDEFAKSGFTRAAIDSKCLSRLTSKLWYVLELLKISEDDTVKRMLITRIADGYIEDFQNPTYNFQSLTRREIIRKIVTTLFNAPWQNIQRELFEEINEINLKLLRKDISVHDFIAAKKRLLEHKDAFVYDTGASRFGFVCTQNILEKPCPECWLCAPADLPINPNSNMADMLKSAPPGSILSVFALRVSEIGPDIEIFSTMWCDFVAMIRWHWDNLILIPIDDDPNRFFNGFPGSPLPVNREYCVVYQKLCLLNFCIAAKAHVHFHHENFDFGCKSDSSEKETSSTPDKIFSIIPWTIDGSLLTEDMIEEDVNILKSLAHSDSGLFESMLSRKIFSDMKAFKHANPRSDFDSYCMWKEPADDVMKLSRQLWSSTECFPESLAEQIIAGLYDGGKSELSLKNRSVFNPNDEGEKIIDYLETIPAHKLMCQIFAIAMDTSMFVLASTAKCFDDEEDRVSQIVTQSATKLRNNWRKKIECPESEWSNSSDAAWKFFAQHIRCMEDSERLMSTTASLLYKFPRHIVGEMLDNQLNSGSLGAKLTKDGSQAERQQVKELIFEEDEQGNICAPTPKRREYLIRALAYRQNCPQPSSATFGRTGHNLETKHTRLSGNRMYASLDGAKITFATALTETSFK